MDDAQKFWESLSLDQEGMSEQLMGLPAFINIILAAIMGFLVLAIYLASSRREGRDKNLYLVIPLLSILMAVIMRIDGPHAVSFFGIFGIMSIIRFRSDITDQKGIAFILFAVIEGVITGMNAYLLALLAWVVVSGSILIGRHFVGRRTGYRLSLRSPGLLAETDRQEAAGWFETRGIPAAFVGYSVSNEDPGKGREWEESSKAEFMLFPKAEEELILAIPDFMALMRDKGITTELKRRECP